MKTCRHCGDDLPRDDFPPNRKTRDGLSSWCRGCHNERNRQYRAELKAEREKAERESQLAYRTALKPSQDAYNRRYNRRRSAAARAALRKRQVPPC